MLPAFQDTAFTKNFKSSVTKNTAQPSKPMIVNAIAAAAARPTPKLSASLQEQYFTYSVFPKAFEVERDQPFGKNNVHQLYTADKAFLHIIFILLKSRLLTWKEHNWVRQTSKLARKLWQEWRQVKHLQPKDFRQFLQPNPASLERANPD